MNSSFPYLFIKDLSRPELTKQFAKAVTEKPKSRMFHVDAYQPENVCCLVGFVKQNTPNKYQEPRILPQ
jgi:hypothetical protein